MSELMDDGIIRMPYEMAMSDELSRKQFYSRANSLLTELTEIRAKLAAIEGQEPVAHAVYQGCLSGVHVAMLANATKDFSGYLYAAKTFAPSHSQQSAEVWQPIEMAPKDGAMVLLFVPLKHNGKFHVGGYRFKDGRWWTDSHSFVSNPTHWMPLPEPPSLDRCPSHESEPSTPDSEGE